MHERKHIIKVQKYGDVEVERIYTEALRPVTMEEFEKLSPEEKEWHAIYAPFQPGTTIEEGDIVCERDVGVKMRDGVTIYADIYKPLNYTGKLPVIISWSIMRTTSRSWACPPRPSPRWQSLSLPTPASGAVMAMPSPTWIPAA